MRHSKKHFCPIASCCLTEWLLGQDKDQANLPSLCGWEAAKSPSCSQGGWQGGPCAHLLLPSKAQGRRSASLPVRRAAAGWSCCTVGDRAPLWRTPGQIAGAQELPAGLPVPSCPQPAGSTWLPRPHSCRRCAPDLSPSTYPRACDRGQPARAVSTAPVLRKNRALRLCTVRLGCKPMCISNDKTATPGEHPMSWSSGKSTIKEQAGSRASV